MMQIAWSGNGHRVAVVLFVFVLAQASWLVLWRRCSYNRDAPVNAPSVAGDRAAKSTTTRRVLLVLQFPPAQWPLMKESFASWSDASLFPCALPRSAPAAVDVVVYVSNDDTGALRREALALLEAMPWRACFDRVLFRDCGLTAAQDVYGAGTLAMFYRTFAPDFVPDVQRYHYSFLMEPDARPIRAMWIDAMEAAVAGPLFWHKGSVPRYDTAPTDLHINGNAFYRLNDPAFTKFVLRSEGAFRPYLSFDQSLHEHRKTLNAQATAHLFVPTEFVVNNWQGFTYYTLDEARRALPETFIMHGKHAVKAVCLHLGCTASVYGTMSKFGG